MSTQVGFRDDFTNWIFLVSMAAFSIILALIIIFFGWKRQQNLLEQRGWVLFFATYTFISATLWINFIAIILLSWLSFIALISNMPLNYLSLTLLAWGNSLGDLFVNYVVAQNGQGSMAVIGTYSGQIFNLLCGFGGALFRQTFVLEK